jgi:hypothetical protein
MIEQFRYTLAQLSRDIASFYDSLPETALREQAAWGRIGATALTDMPEAEAVSAKVKESKTR